MGSMLKNVYQQTKAKVEQELHSAPFVGLCSDGWKKKYAEFGVPLVNVMALLPQRHGGSRFLEVIKAEGVTKDAEWIRDSHVENGDVCNVCIHTCLYA